MRMSIPEGILAVLAIAIAVGTVIVITIAQLPSARTAHTGSTTTQIGTTNTR